MHILIAEDQALLRDGMTRMLTAYGFEVTVANPDGARLPDVVAQLLSGPGTLATLTAREREVLSLMAEGHSNGAIADRLTITEKSVSNVINTLFDKLGLPPAAHQHRRVLAVLSYLDQR